MTPAGVRHLLSVVVGVWVVSRVIVAVMLGDTATPISGAFDQLSYDTLAQRVLGGHGFSFPTGWYPFTPPDTPTAHWSFAYTLYLAGVYAIAGHHPLVARVIQAILSALTAVLLYRLGRRLFDERMGLAAATLAAGYAYLVFFNAALMTQTFYIVCVLAAIDLAFGVVTASGPGRWVGLGVALGVGALLRQTLLLFTPLLLLWIGWHVGVRRCWRGLALTATVVVLCVSPFTIRNYLVYDDFLLLNSNGGYFFYSGNHPAQGTDFDPNYAAPLPEALRGLNEAAEDRALYRVALQFILDDPVRFVRLSLSRVKDYFWLTPSPQSSLVSNLGRLASFTLYLPLMLLGLYLSRRQWRRALPLYLYAGFDAFVHLTSWAAPRYRLPSDAVLMVFAGVAAVALAERVSWPRRLLVAPEGTTRRA